MSRLTSLLRTVLSLCANSSRLNTPSLVLKTWQQQHTTQSQKSQPRDSIRPSLCTFHTTSTNIKATGIHLCSYLRMRTTRNYRELEAKHNSSLSLVNTRHEKHSCNPLAQYYPTFIAKNRFQFFEHDWKPAFALHKQNLTPMLDRRNSVKYRIMIAVYTKRQ